MTATDGAFLERAARCRALALDIDGTMLDSERVIMRLWGETARSMGCDFSEKMMISTIGTDGDETRRIMREAYPDAPHEAIRDAMWARYYKMRVAGTVPKKHGLTELLAVARARGMRVGVCTSSRRDAAEASLSGVGLIDRIDALVCAYETERGKPDPAPYRLVAQKLGVAPDECIGVEDSPAGARSVIGAGLVAVVVPDLLPVPPDVGLRAVELRSLEDLASALRAASGIRG